MRKLTIISMVLLASALLIFPSFSAIAGDNDEGVPWFGLIPYLLTGGPPSGKPKAVFTADPISGTAPLTVVFDATSSEDPNGAIESYEWDFDDGGSATEIQASHTYTSAGEYTPKLTITDDDGKTDSYSNLTISVTSKNEPPNASFTADPNSGTAPVDVTFDASDSSDPEGSIESYSWDFGDGASGTGETVTHTYSSAGSYTAQLTVEDDDGASDSTITQIEVTGPEEEKWSFRTGNSVDSSPALKPDGTIYVGSGDHNLYAINPDGTKKWSFQTGGWIGSSPAIGFDGTIYVGSDDGNLYAINGKTGGLARSPWPMFQGGPRHIGRAE